MPRKSVVTVPIHLTHAALNEVIASATPAILASEDDFLGRGIRLRVSRADRPQIGFRQNGGPASGAVTVDLKLAAAVELAKATRIFGATSARGALELDVSVGVRVRGWSLLTSTEIADHRWIETPRLNIAAVALGLGALSDGVLRLLADRIGRRIDAEIERRQPLRLAILRARAELERPKSIVPELDLTLRARVLDLGLGALRTHDRGMGLTVAAGIELLATTTPRAESGAPGTSADLPPNSGVPGDEGSFDVRPEVSIGFDRLTSAAREALVGQRFEKFGRWVEVLAVSFEGGEAAGLPPTGLRIGVELGGAVEASLTVEGDLAISSAGRHVEFGDARVRVVRGGLLLRGLIGLAGRRIAAEIERRVAADSAAGLSRAHREITVKLSGGSPGGGVVADGDLRTLRLERLLVRTAGVLAEARLVGAVALRIERIPPNPAERAV